ncbi:MAG: heat shock protein HspQ [Magnetococcales bacterium]|nr:heat shock protein HspQ [Magnetococcales bacterium]
MSVSVSKFYVGQVVCHNLFDYRGVIVDVDPSYQKDMAWYDRMARTRPPKDQPWYQILVHDSKSESYVAERNLRIDESQEPVKNPHLYKYFQSFAEGLYHRRIALH